MMDSFDLEAFAKEVNKLAHEKGWYDPAPSNCERAACIHCEWSEALQAYRNNEPAETIATELIDGVLRLLEMAAESGDKLRYMYSRIFIGQTLYDPKKWKRKSLPAIVVSAHSMVSRGDFCRCASDVICWVQAQGLDPFKLMREKHEYNKTRPYRHGNKRC